MFWLVIGLGVGIILLPVYAVFRGRRLRSWIASAGLMVAAVTVFLIGIEWLLAVRERMPSPHQRAPLKPLRRDVRPFRRRLHQPDLTGSFEGARDWGTNLSIPTPSGLLADRVGALSLSFLRTRCAKGLN